MTEPYEDVLARLLWALRRYAIGVVLVVIAAVAASTLLGSRSGPPVYESRALIAATSLRLRPDQLPRLASMVFNTAGVAQAAVAAGDLPYDADDLIPEHAEVDPVEDNILVFVEGRDHDPRMAAQIATAVAEALVVELNKPGAELANFEVLQEGDLPTNPEPGRPPYHLLAGLFGGPFLAVGALVALLAVRRPVLSAAEAESLTGVRTFPVFGIGRSGKTLPTPVHVIGLSALVTATVPDARGVVVVFTAQRRKRAGLRLAYVLAQRLRQLVPTKYTDRVRFAGDEEIASETAADAQVEVIAAPPVDTVDLSQLLPKGARAILVATEGIPRLTLLAAASRFEPEDLAALAFAAPGSPRRRFGRSSGGA